MKNGVLRGGSSFYYPWNLRTTNRFRSKQSRRSRAGGFRIVVMRSKT